MLERVDGDSDEETPEFYFGDGENVFAELGGTGALPEGGCSADPDKLNVGDGDED